MHLVESARTVRIGRFLFGLVLLGCGSARAGRPPDGLAPIDSSSASPASPVRLSDAPDIPSGGAAPAADTPEPMVAIVRARSPQLRSCYEEQGLKHVPDLAGTLSVGVEVGADGAVTGARIVVEEWSSAASEGETTRNVTRCILERVARWRFPPEAVIAGKHTFDFRFSR